MCKKHYRKLYCIEPGHLKRVPDEQSCIGCRTDIKRMKYVRRLGEVMMRNVKTPKSITLSLIFTLHSIYHTISILSYEDSHEYSNTYRLLCITRSPSHNSNMWSKEQSSHDFKHMSSVVMCSCHALHDYTILTNTLGHHQSHRQTDHKY